MARDRAKRSTEATLDEALGIISTTRTLMMMLAKHEEDCDRGMTCMVADAILRRMRQITSSR